MKYLLAMVFVVVQVVGEQYNFLSLPIGITQACIMLLLAITIVNIGDRIPKNIGSIDVSLLLFALYLVIPMTVGLKLGTDWSNIRDDMSPLFFLIISYIISRLIVRSVLSMRTVINGILVGSGLAAVKLIYIIKNNVDVEWSGPWQAARVDSPNFTRVILLGADLYFVVSTILVFSLWLLNRRNDNWKIALGAASAMGVFLSGTRSNWIGLVAGLAVVLLVSKMFTKFHLHRFVLIGAIGFILLITAYVLSGSFQAMVVQVGDNTLNRLDSITIRLNESEGVLASIGEAGIFGNGMGATYDYYDMFTKNMTTEPYSHNGFLMLLLKAGPIGLILFLLVVYRVMLIAYRLIRAGHPCQVEIIGMVGSILAILILSIGVNKIFALSGALFMGWSFATIQSSSVVGGFRKDESLRKVEQTQVREKMAKTMICD